MWPGIAKIFLGIWMIFSALFDPLQSPYNLMVVGLMCSVCCFCSNSILLGLATGIIGFWLFSMGMLFLLNAVSVLSPVYFLVSGILLFILGILYQILRIQQSKSAVTAAPVT